MYCSNCQAEILDDSRFCSKCGAPSSPSEETPTRTSALGPAAELAPGTVLAGKFKILEGLGQGGMGVVYKAEDTKLRRLVALKFLPPQLSGNPEFRERLLTEARAAAALSHPNICTVHEIHDEGDRAFLEMEYVEGQTLSDRVKEGPLEPNEAVAIALQVAEALEEAHRGGVIHRDIKSPNVMVTAKGQAKVMDFGLARVQGETLHTKPGTLLGTVAYMSPEQARGEPVDARTDIWSLGVVFYEMLGGRRPFKGDSEVSVLYAILNKAPTPLKEVRPDLPPELYGIVDQALRKDVGKRYGSAAEMGADLRAYRESVQAEELRVLTPRAVLRQLRRRRVAVPLALGLGVLAVAGYAYADRRAKVRWATETALPQIERMIEENDAWRNLVPPYRLAEKAEAIIPRDPRLAELSSKCSLRIDIETEPPGAKVYMKEYAAPESEWTYLGVSPIEKIRVPIGIFRWRFEKEGYEPVLAASSTWDTDNAKPDIVVPYTLTRTLDRVGSIPAEMVRVQGAKAPVGVLPDFFIDRHEVTNKQYKDFLNKGGYRNETYWKHKFIRDGKELRRDQAMKEFVDQTGQPGPATWQAGDYSEGQVDYPVSGISWYEAAAYAEYAGKSLPTGAHWNLARGAFTPLIQVPQLGGFAVFAPFSNFTIKGPVPVGSMPGITSFGAYDMAGNVREWCWNETPRGRLIRGGAWDDNTYMFRSRSQAPAMDRSAKNGLRCALYPDLGKIPEAALGFIKLGQPGDFYSQKPVPDAIFKVYREQFSYDRTDLHARVESKQERPADWIHERITFDAAYGGERIIAHLFLPMSTTPPYQTVIYFPGSASTTATSSEDLENYYEFPMFLSYIVKSGRAALYPVYKGTFERGTAAAPALHIGDESHAYTEYLVQVVKDLRRCIDYLETRQDIESKKLAFYGMSWGGRLAAIIPAVEDRLKANIVVAGGLTGRGRPEAKQINYVGRVRAPTLMLTGRYDTIFDLETSQKPMFDLLGATDKQWKVYATDHIPPRTEYIRETLAWLDRYLGPVK